MRKDILKDYRDYLQAGISIDETIAALMILTGLSREDSVAKLKEKLKEMEGDRKKVVL